MQEMWVQSLSQDHYLEKEMATLEKFAWENLHGPEKPGEIQSMRLQRIRHGLVTKQQQMDHEEIMITQPIQGCPRTTSLAYSSSHYDCLYS